MAEIMRAKELFDLADQLRKDGQLEAARTTVEEGLTLDQNSSWGVSVKAHIAFDLGFFEESRFVYQHALEINPLDQAPGLPSSNNKEFLLSLYMQLGSACTQLAEQKTSKEEWREAQKAYRKALDIDDTISNAWLGLGVALCAQGNGVDAISALERSIKCDPKNVTAYLELQVINGLKAGKILKEADSAFSEKRYDEALKLARHALELDPGSYEAAALQGAALDDLGLVEGSIAMFERALGLVELLRENFLPDPDPKEYEAYLNICLGMAQVRMALAGRDRKKWRRAEETFQRAMALNGPNPYVLYGLGECEWFTGSKSEAVDIYERCIEIDPRYIDAHIEIVKCNLYLLRFRKALSAFRRARPLLEERYNKRCLPGR